MYQRCVQIAVVVAWVGCGGGDTPTGTAMTSARVAGTCKPGEVHMCPCPAGGQGTQTCDPTGMGFGACAGCTARGGSNGSATIPGPGAPVSSAAGRGIGGGGAAATTAGIGASGSGGAAAQGGSSGGGGSSSAGTGGRSGSGGSGGRAGSSSAGTSNGGRPAPLPAVKGVTCGIGLPVQCKPDTEKCCKRSLATDVCAPLATACECEEENCLTIDVKCDGPEDCASGQVCCSVGGSSSSSGGGGRPRPGGGGRFTEFACAASCGSGSRAACHVDDDCMGSQICAISQSLPTISVCTNPSELEQ